MGLTFFVDCTHLTSEVRFRWGLVCMMRLCFLRITPTTPPKIHPLNTVSMAGPGLASRMEGINLEITAERHMAEFKLLVRTHKCRRIFRKNISCSRSVGSVWCSLLFTNNYAHYRTDIAAQAMQVACRSFCRAFGTPM